MVLLQLKLRFKIWTPKSAPIKKIRPDLLRTLKILANEPQGAMFRATFAFWDTLMLVCRGSVSITFLYNNYCYAVLFFKHFMKERAFWNGMNNKKRESASCHFFELPGGVLNLVFSRVLLGVKF